MEQCVIYHKSITDTLDNNSGVASREIVDTVSSGVVGAGHDNPIVSDIMEG